MTLFEIFVGKSSTELLLPLLHGPNRALLILDVLLKEGSKSYNHLVPPPAELAKICQNQI
jgi:hypothetical protein